MAAAPVKIASPMVGTVSTILVSPGQAVAAGAELVTIESMKMEHAIATAEAGTVAAVLVTVGQPVEAGTVLVEVTAAPAAHLQPAPGPDEASLPAPGPTVATPRHRGQGRAPESAGEATSAGDATSAAAGAGAAASDLRPELAELLARRALLADEARPDAVAAQQARGHRTLRANIADLCDPGTFQEHGGFAVAAQRARRTLDDLRRNTPADGLVTGIGRINGDRFGEAGRCAVLGYDYTVLAGTQGYNNHRKKDRLFELIERLRLPTVLFATGGGGRPGDVDAPQIAGLDTEAFALWARLSALVPTVGIANGWCFAGNAALLGCSDVVIATRDAGIGMGGPAMIEGGGLGVHRPHEVGPVSVQAPNGVVDLVADDDAHAVALAKQYLSYFQGTLPPDAAPAPDPTALRTVVPEQRTRAYDTRAAIEGIFDLGSVLELRAEFGIGVRTALARLAGRPVGVVANHPGHLGGAIDTPAADKLARFLQLCDAYDLPVVSLCDTPGFMVGPEAEATAQVRHFSRIFVTAASMTVPWITVVLRKGYGLGAQAMCGGSFHRPLATLSWPTGEFGGMGLEGSVRLGFRKELEAQPDEVSRQALYQELVDAAYERGKALSMATALEIDDVIDPAETRTRLEGLLAACPAPAPRTAKKRPMIDTW